MVGRLRSEHGLCFTVPFFREILDDLFELLALILNSVQYAKKTEKQQINSINKHKEDERDKKEGNKGILRTLL